MHELQRSRRIVDAMSWLDMAGGRLFDKLTQRRISEAAVTRLKEECFNPMCGRATGTELLRHSASLKHARMSFKQLGVLRSRSVDDLSCIVRT